MLRYVLPGVALLPASVDESEMCVKSLGFEHFACQALQAVTVALLAWRAAAVASACVAAVDMFLLIVVFCSPP